MVNVLFQNSGEFPVKNNLVEKAVVDTLSKNKISGNAEVSVAVVSEKEMEALSKKYMKDGKKHEVLAFPLEDSESPDGIWRLGDIILCYPEVVLAAKRDGVIVDDEIYSLTAHSVEHLLGKHHK